jgi:hypothetical protein
MKFVLITLTTYTVRDQSSYYMNLLFAYFFSFMRCLGDLNGVPRPERLWDPRNLLLNGYQGLLPWG